MYSIKDGWTSSRLVFSNLIGSFRSALLPRDDVSALDDLVEDNFLWSQSGALLVSNLLNITRACPPKMASSSVLSPSWRCGRFIGRTLPPRN